MKHAYPLVALSEVLTQNRQYIEAPEPRLYPKLSVRLYGKGVVLDPPVDGSSLKMSRHQIAGAGQVILSEIWGKKGAIGLVPPDGDGALCTSHFFLFEVRCDRIDPDYLQAIFSANYLERHLGEDAQGTTGYAAVRPAHLLAATIPLPTIEEQRRLVARIDSIARRRTTARRLRDQCAADTRALLGSLNASLAGIRHLRLSDILTLDEDRKPIDLGRAYPQVGVRGFGQGLFPKEAVVGGSTTYRWFNRLYEGALVLSQVKGWEGAVAVCPAELAGAFVSPEYRTFRFRPDQADPRYMASLVATPWFWQQLASLDRGVGARRGRTRPEHFVQIELPLPTIEQQRRVLPVLDRLRAAQELQHQTLAELDALMPAVLDRAFGGQL